MSNYNWLEFADLSWVERYPDWVEAVGLWRESADGDEEALERLLDALVRARASVPWGVPGTELSRPRVFVSHRRNDQARARDIATLAIAEGFQVWLDVLDPTVQRIAGHRKRSALALATAVEMALLNSTHVLAVITPNTRGTMWVPYEYGRVKDSSPHSLNAACWIDGQVTDPPEYLELSVKTATDDEIRTWLRRELAAWNRRHPASVPVSSPAPTQQPATSDAEKLRHIERTFGRLTRAVIAPEPAEFERKKD